MVRPSNRGQLRAYGCRKRARRKQSNAGSLEFDVRQYGIGSHEKKIPRSPSNTNMQNARLYCLRTTLRFWPGPRMPMLGLTFRVTRTHHPSLLAHSYWSTDHHSLYIIGPLTTKTEQTRAPRSSRLQTQVQGGENPLFRVASTFFSARYT